jgi:outer membrane receptor protein involved in Fe transport
MARREAAKLSASSRDWRNTLLSVTAISSGLFMSVAITPSAAIAADQAQVAQAQTAQSPSVEEIVVTGTRIVRDGYEAPTPVSVITPDQLQSNATGNVADYINTMPALAGSSTPRTTVGVTSTGQAAVNASNLRGLGTVRTLTLVDGQRIVGSLLTGVVDASELPQQLISRVDVETGGASATYGSDALTGVINYILDKNFNGVKGEASGGVTTYGDDRSWKLELTAGTPFANDRGHFEISGEAESNDGVQTPNRPWILPGWGVINNPSYSATCGCPQNIVTTQVSLAYAGYGGVIDSGPLKGTAFGPGGVPYPLVYGSLLAPPLMSGGSWQSTMVNTRTTGQILDPVQSFQNAFARASYDVADNVNVWAQFSWAHLHSVSNSVNVFYPGPGSLVIKTDNAYIPASLQATALAGGTSFTFGTLNADLGIQHPIYDRRVVRAQFGADGNFNAMDTNWKWNAYFATGFTMQSATSGDTINITNYNQAIDAVKGPNGTIVCRSTLTNPTNGCVPYNLFGIGVNSQAAINYVHASPNTASRLLQRVASASLTGNPFSDWAGPVSLALNIEHREESTRGRSDPLLAAGVPFFLSVPPGYSGKFTVTEGAIETVIPLAKDTAWAKSLDLDGAVRETGYSTFGSVTTWKVGLSYSPIDDLRFRGRHSYDIREPTLVDLYQAPSASSSTVLNPFLDNALVAYRSIQSGNLDLRPENAHTTGVGVVYQPSWLRGFSASVDYYHVRISDGISSGLSPQQIINTCYAGNQTACGRYVSTSSGGNPVLVFSLTPINIATEDAKGIDIEASYTVPLSDLVSNWDGKLSIRGLATHYISDYLDPGVAGLIPYQQAGMNSGSNPPHWRTLLNVNYTLDPVSVTLTGRGISGGVYNTTNIECTSGCPASTTTHVTINDNHLPGAFYLDLGATYDVLKEGENSIQVFLNVRNIMDHATVVPQGPGGNGYSFIPSNAALYDLLGRMFRAGVRFKM